ncbi:hypothetical protein BaRGS_00023597, partial [Batillaria attramentaria]
VESNWHHKGLISIYKHSQILYANASTPPLYEEATTRPQFVSNRSISSAKAHNNPAELDTDMS